jgi:hypothetical protein
MNRYNELIKSSLVELDQDETILIHYTNRWLSKIDKMKNKVKFLTISKACFIEVNMVYIYVGSKYVKY